MTDTGGGGGAGGGLFGNGESASSGTVIAVGAVGGQSHPDFGGGRASVIVQGGVQAPYGATGGFGGGGGSTDSIYGGGGGGGGYSGGGGGALFESGGGGGSYVSDSFVQMSAEVSNRGNGSASIEAVRYFGTPAVDLSQLQTYRVIRQGDPQGLYAGKFSVTNSAPVSGISDIVRIATTYDYGAAGTYDFMTELAPGQGFTETASYLGGRQPGFFEQVQTFTATSIGQAHPEYGVGAEVLLDRIDVKLSGVVTAAAVAGLSASGAGTFGPSQYGATVYSLNLGSFTAGSARAVSTINVSNLTAGSDFAEYLATRFTVHPSDVAGYSFTGADAGFEDIAGGQSKSYSFAFDPRGLAAGVYTRAVSFTTYSRWRDLPGSQYYDVASPNQVVITARVEPAAAAMPEPETWGLMLLGFGLVGAVARRRGEAVPA